MSPEYGAARDTSYDLALLRWGLKTLIHIATELLPAGENEEGGDFSARLKYQQQLLPVWNRTLHELSPYHTNDEQGLMIGENMNLSHGHRHWSNLFAIFPTYDIVYGKDAKTDTLINTSVSWWEHFHPTNGFTYAGAAIYNALQPNGAGAEAARQQLTDFVYTDKKGGDNTLYSEGSQCNESPLMTAFALQQMLLQSWSPAPNPGGGDSFKPLGPGS
eukprot:UC1_evm1s2127